MTGYSVAIFILAIFTCGFYIWFVFAYLPRQRRVNQKYPLFAVRDELVYLKQQGMFDDDPELFYDLCGVCNSLIVRTKELNFRLFLTALASVSTDVSGVEQLMARVKNAPRPVQLAETRLWDVVQAILVENSTILRLVKLLHAYKLVKDAPAEFTDTYAFKPVKQYFRAEDMKRAIAA